MGGCKEGKDTCTNKTCKGYEVDLMHFSIGNAIPGRLYGGNNLDIGTGGDRCIKSYFHHLHTYKSTSAQFLFKTI